MLDWLGKMIGLPKEFLACSGGKGGGVIQGTASEATLVALLGAKARTIAAIKKEKPELNDADIVAKLVGYTSSEFLNTKVSDVLLMRSINFCRPEPLVGGARGAAWGH